MAVKGEIKKKKKILLLISIVILLLLSVLAFITYPNPKTGPMTDFRYIKFTQTKSDDDYILTIYWIRESEINSKGNICSLIDQDGFLRYQNDLPIISGEIGSISDNNLTVTWFDNDNNGKLSIDDSFKIESLDQDLIGYTFDIKQPIDGVYYRISYTKLY